MAISKSEWIGFNCQLDGTRDVIWAIGVLRERYTKRTRSQALKHRQRIGKHHNQSEHRRPNFRLDVRLFSSPSRYMQHLPAPNLGQYVTAHADPCHAKTLLVLSKSTESAKPPPFLFSISIREDTINHPTPTQTMLFPAQFRHSKQLMASPHV